MQLSAQRKRRLENLDCAENSHHRDVGMLHVEVNQDSFPPQIRTRTTGRGCYQLSASVGRGQNSSRHATRGRGRGRRGRGHGVGLELNSQDGRRIQLPPTSRCEHCDAFKFGFESPTFCCGGGTVALPQADYPPELVRLFTSQDEDALHFQKYSRMYNNLFAFSSLSRVTLVSGREEHSLSEKKICNIVSYEVLTLAGII